MTIANVALTISEYAFWLVKVSNGMAQIMKCTFRTWLGVGRLMKIKMTCLLICGLVQNKATYFSLHACVSETTNALVRRQTKNSIGCLIEDLTYEDCESAVSCCAKANSL